jgi:hypothetical protein
MFLIAETIACIAFYFLLMTPGNSSDSPSANKRARGAIASLALFGN